MLQWPWYHIAVAMVPCCSGYGAMLDEDVPDLGSADAYGATAVISALIFGAALTVFFEFNPAACMSLVPANL